MNVALFGGTFNPVHNGHLFVAKEVYRLLCVDTVVFIPAYCPPHKTGEGLVSPEHRLEMLKRALQGMPFCDISAIEIAKREVCYTVDTVRELKQGHPEWQQVYFLVGSDALPFLYNWQAAEELFSEVTIVVLKRPGYAIEGHDDRFIYLDNCEYESASRDIRASLAGAVEQKAVLPASVAAYIKDHALYEAVK